MPLYLFRGVLHKGFYAFYAFTPLLEEEKMSSNQDQQTLEELTIECYSCSGAPLTAATLRAMAAARRVRCSVCRRLMKWNGRNHDDDDN
jgi:hypothetical protein